MEAVLITANGKAHIACLAYVAESHNPEATRLISLYRDRETARPTAQAQATTPLGRIGGIAA